MQNEYDQQRKMTKEEATEGLLETGVTAKAVVENGERSQIRKRGKEQSYKKTNVLEPSLRGIAGIHSSRRHRCAFKEALSQSAVGMSFQKCINHGVDSFCTGCNRLSQNKASVAAKDAMSQMPPQPIKHP